MNSQNKTLSTLLAICLSLAFGLFVGYLVGFKYGKTQSTVRYDPAISPPISSQESPIKLSSEANEVVEVLNCVCGCGMELLPCTCDELRGSREIKLYVQGLVNQGLTKPEVIERVAQKYTRDVLKKDS